MIKHNDKTRILLILLDVHYNVLTVTLTIVTSLTVMSHPHCPEYNSCILGSPLSYTFPPIIFSAHCENVLLRAEGDVFVSLPRTS